MAKFHEEQILSVLRGVKYPGFTRDIVSFGIVKSIQCKEGHTVVHIEVSTADETVPAALEASVQEALRQLDSQHEFEVVLTRKALAVTPPGGQPNPKRLAGVKHVIAIASGKGGVGKSTVAVNLACALSLDGASVGLCDCDLYGPSISLMLGTYEHPMVSPQEKIIPVEQFGIKLLSLAFFTDPSQPAVLRGPLVTRYTQQFLLGTEWEGTDFLILDLPPGTGDIQLTVVQSIALSGAVIVTTPQEVALIDARKAIAMFQKVNTPVLGIVENMSYFECPNDGNIYYIFGEGGGREEAKRLGVPLLAEVPLEIATRESGDQGRPIVLNNTRSKSAQAFLQAAAKIKELCPV